MAITIDDIMGSQKEVQVNSNSTASVNTAPVPKKGRNQIEKTNPSLTKGRISTYQQRDALFIPEEVRERFKADGWVLRWIRQTLGVRR